MDYILLVVKSVICYDSME